MKFCSKCGKEIIEEAVVCPSCGCAMEEKAPQISYEEALKNSATTNIISIIALVLGIISWLFINMWLGAILCLVAEFIALVPNSKINKAFKQNGLNKTNKAEMKAIIKDLKAQNSAYKFSKIIAIIALILLVIFVLFI